MTRYDIIITVSEDRFGERSLSVKTSPAGISPAEVDEVLYRLTHSPVAKLATGENGKYY